MEVKAEHRYAKISAFKVREVTREIQGLPAEAGPGDRAPYSQEGRPPHREGAGLGHRQRGEQQQPARARDLVIKQAIAGEGPTMKRMHTRARGGGARINKRTAHISITLTEAEPSSKSRSRRASRRQAQDSRFQEDQPPRPSPRPRRRQPASRRKRRRPANRCRGRTPEKVTSRNHRQLWDKKLIQSAFASASTAPGAPCGTPRRRTSRSISTRTP